MIKTLQNALKQDREAVLFANTEAVVSVYNNHVLVDNDWGIASVFKDIPL